MHSLDRVPTLNEINVFNSLDERTAAAHFLGKNLQQAEELFRENFLYYQEDLMWMGPKAFCYYVPAAVAYLISAASDGDSDAASSFCGVLEFRLDDDREAMLPVFAHLRGALEFIISNYAKYGCDLAIDGDVASRYRTLLTRFPT
jgi:hypothetical protein